MKPTRQQVCQRFFDKLHVAGGRIELWKPHQPIEDFCPRAKPIGIGDGGGIADVATRSRRKKGFSFQNLLVGGDATIELGQKAGDGKKVHLCPNEGYHRFRMCFEMAERPRQEIKRLWKWLVYWQDCRVELNQC